MVYSKLKKIFSKKTAASQKEDVKTKKTAAVTDMTKQEPAAVGQSKTERETGNAYRILKKALISEKAAFLAEGNKYCFLVDPAANKSEIKKAINKVYGVKPIKVNIVNVFGKKVRFGRFHGKKQDYKKAIVVLSKGQKIEIYEGV